MVNDCAKCGKPQMTRAMIGTCEHGKICTACYWELQELKKAHHASVEAAECKPTCEWLYCRECGSVTSIPSLMSLVNIKCEICWRKLNKINLNTINLLNNTLQDTIKALQTIEDYIIKGTVDNVTDLIETLNLVLEATSTNYPKTLENITSIEDIPNEYNSRIW